MVLSSFDSIFDSQQILLLHNYDKSITYTEYLMILTVFLKNLFFFYRYSYLNVNTLFFAIFSSNWLKRYSKIFSGTIKRVNVGKIMEEAKELNLWILCLGEKWSKTLRFCANGMQNIKSASNIIGDAIFQSTDDENNVKYHMFCYRTYILKGKQRLKLAEEAH